MKLKVRLPPYKTPRTTWRRKLHEAIESAMIESGIRFTEKDRLSLEVRLYMDAGQLNFHDVDNRLKTSWMHCKGESAGMDQGSRCSSL